MTFTRADLTHHSFQYPNKIPFKKPLVKPMPGSTWNIIAKLSVNEQGLLTQKRVLY
jgi:hypothetical protein